MKKNIKNYIEKILEMTILNLRKELNIINLEDIDKD